MSRRKHYVVHATVVKKRGGWTSSVQVPTFLLDADVQGIVSEEHAERVARQVVDPLGLADRVHISVALTAGSRQ